jgi:hypothetical protein
LKYKITIYLFLIVIYTKKYLFNYKDEYKTVYNKKNK